MWELYRGNVQGSAQGMFFLWKLVPSSASYQHVRGEAKCTRNTCPCWRGTSAGVPPEHVTFAGVPSSPWWAKVWSGWYMRRHKALPHRCCKVFKVEGWYHLQDLHAPAPLELRRRSRHRPWLSCQGHLRLPGRVMWRSSSRIRFQICHMS